MMTSRRAYKYAAVALIASLTLSACGSSGNDNLAQQANNEGTNYIAGDGSVEEFAPENREAPVEFESTLFDGSTINEERWQGDVTVLNFWYAACAPCRVEAPDLQEIYTEYADEGVQFYGVNTRDTEPTAEAFERNFGITYPSMEDRGGQVMMAMTGFVPPSAVPTTLVLDKQGRVSARILGVAEPSTLRALIDSALEESGPETSAADDSAVSVPAALSAKRESEQGT